MIKPSVLLIVVFSLFVMFNSNAGFSVVKASDIKLNDIEPSLLYRPNYDGDIVFSSNARGNYNLYQIAADSRELHEITHDPGDEINPSISPDGTHVAYAQNNEGDWNITVMNLESLQQWNLTHCCSDEMEPDWSDWDRIAYQSNKHGDWDIMWKDAWGPEAQGGTSEGMEIARSPMDETNPAWGRYNFAHLIAFVRADQNGKDVMAYDTDRRQEFRTPGAGPGNQTIPFWFTGQQIFPDAGPGPVIIYQPDDHGLNWGALQNQSGGALLKNQNQSPRRIPMKSATMGMSEETIGFVTDKGEIMVFDFHGREDPGVIDVREHRGRILDMDWGPMSGHGGGGGFLGMGGGGGGRQPQGQGPGPGGGGRGPGGGGGGQGGGGGGQGPGGGGGGMMDRMRNMVGGGGDRGGPSQMEQQMMEEGRKMMAEQEEMQRRMMEEQRSMEEEQRQRENQRRDEDQQRQEDERDRRRGEDREQLQMEEERRALELKSERERLSMEDERRMRELEQRREEMNMEREMRDEQNSMDEERRERERVQEQERMEQQARMMEEQRRMMREETAARGGAGPGPGGGGPGGPTFYVRGASEEQYNCMVSSLGPPVVEQFNFRDPRPEEYERMGHCEDIPELFGQEVYNEDDRGFFGKPKVGGIKGGGPADLMGDPTMLAMAGLVVTVGATLLQMARGK